MRLWSPRETECTRRLTPAESPIRSREDVATAKNEFVPSRSRISSAPTKDRETSLLLSFIGATRYTETTSITGGSVQTGIDWEYLIRAACSHGVAPLLYQHLRDTRQGVVPEHVLDQLKNHFETNRLRSLYLSGELMKLVERLEACGVHALPYKGPVLASLAYGNPALREFGDLDVLVGRGDVLRATDALTSLGYRSAHYADSAQAAFLRYERQYAFERADGCVVELHWTVTPRSISFLPTPEDLWVRAAGTPFGGGVVSTLSSEDLLLSLCIHGSAHLWERLVWICDVAELVRAPRGVDWERLLERASASRSRRMLLLGLLLAEDLLGAELPAGVLGEVRADAVARALAAEVCERLFDHGQEVGGVPQAVRWRFHLRMLDGVPDKLRYCAHRLTTPTLHEWEVTPLPAALFFCYRLLRPIRLSVRFGRGLAETLPRRPGWVDELVRVRDVSVARFRAGQHGIRELDNRCGRKQDLGRVSWGGKWLRRAVTRLRKFIRLRYPDQRLLVEAAVLLGTTRLGLWLLPFRAVRRLLAGVACVPAPSRHMDGAFAARVAWATETAGRHMPPARTCLTEALAAQVLLVRAGRPALLHIGVVKGDEDQLEAHAWVESGGEVVVGGFGIERYIPLTVLGLGQGGEIS